MKRFWLVAVAFFVMLISVGCTGRNEPEASTYGSLVDYSQAFPEFKSVKDLVKSHKTVRKGKAVGELAAAAENTNFIELDKLYVPTVIPVGYHLYKIEVFEPFVRFSYLLESDMVSPDAVADAFNQGQGFSFLFHRRQDADIVMDAYLQHCNATEEDLIDGKYLFVEPSELCWLSDGVFFALSMPLPLLEKQPDEQAKIAEMIKYAEVEVVDLGG